MIWVLCAILAVLSLTFWGLYLRAKSESTTLMYYVLGVLADDNIHADEQVKLDHALKRLDEDLSDRDIFNLFYSFLANICHQPDSKTAKGYSFAIGVEALGMRRRQLSRAKQ